MNKDRIRQLLLEKGMPEYEFKFEWIGTAGTGIICHTDKSEAFMSLLPVDDAKDEDFATFVYEKWSQEAKKRT